MGAGEPGLLDPALPVRAESPQERLVGAAILVDGQGMIAVVNMRAQPVLLEFLSIAFERVTRSCSCPC